MQRQLILDVGNTSLRYALFEGDVLLRSALHTHDALYVAFEEHIINVDRCFMATVAPDVAARWLKRLALPCPVTTLHHSDIPLRNHTSAPERVGIDRLINAYAAYRKSGGAIVVDAGSAITWDVVSPAGEFLGGAIAPGPGLSLRALHAYTERLPDVPVPSHLPETPLGRSSEEAILSGVAYGMLGMIAEVTRRLADELDFSPSLYLTGGYGVLIKEELGKLGYVHDENLTLRGIALAGAALS